MDTCKGSLLRRVMAVIMVLMILLGSSVNAESLLSEEEKAKIEKMEIDGKTEDDYLKDIEELDETYSKVELELADLELEIEQVLADIEQGERESKALEKEIEDLEAEIDEAFELLGDRLRVYQRNKGVNNFTIILASTSIKEVVMKSKMVMQITKYDKDITERLTRDKEELNKKKLELLDTLAELEKSSESLKDKEIELESKMEELNELKEEKEKELEEHKGKILEEMERQEEELARIAKEAQEAEEAERLRIEALDRMSNGEDIGELDIVELKGDTRLRYPFDRAYRVSSPFGTRIHPIKKVKKFHSGVDFAAPAGTKVRSLEDGVVIWSSTRGGYGKTVMINHGSGVVSLYAHNSELLVNVGDKVSRGQLIAKVGSTGMSTGPHLHLEVRLNGKATNPLEWMK